MVETRKQQDAATNEAGAKQAAAKRAELKERHTEATKSTELEKSVKDLGLDAEDLEIQFIDGIAAIEGTVATQQDVRGSFSLSETTKVSPKWTRRSTSPKTRPGEDIHGCEGRHQSKIAKEYYGEGSKSPTIFEANKPMLKNPDLIYPGQVLRIPAL